MVGDLHQFVYTIMKGNAHQLCTLAKTLVVFCGFEDLGSVYCAIGANAFEYTISEMQGLTEQIHLRIFRFHKQPIEEENRVVVVVHSFLNNR